MWRGEILFKLLVYVESNYQSSKSNYISHILGWNFKTLKQVSTDSFLGGLLSAHKIVYISYIFWYLNSLSPSIMTLWIRMKLMIYVQILKRFLFRRGCKVYFVALFILDLCESHQLIIFTLLGYFLELISHVLYFYIIFHCTVICYTKIFMFFDLLHLLEPSLF